MLFLPKGLERSVPDSFASQIRALDPNLIVYFNPMKQRWVVDRCTRGGARNAALHEHTPECPRTNVMVVRDGEQYMPLCEAVLDDLRAADSWKHSTVEQFILHHDNIAAEDEASRNRQIDAVFREASLDNKRQLQKAYHLTQIHDVHRVTQ
jgi:hypothetical protein